MVRFWFVCGHTPSGFTSSCLQFNSQSKTWEHHSSLKSKDRYKASAIALKHGVYILGGFGKSTSTWSSSEFLATGSTVWTPGPNIPGRVYGSCGVKLSDTEFVILGGIDDGTQALVYSTTKNKWTEWPKLSEKVYGQSCMKFGETILMAGGRNSKSVTRRTHIFDIKTGSAREVASLKYSRVDGAMAFYRGKPLILGGWRSDGEIWNVDTEAWEETDISLNSSTTSFSLVATHEEIKCE